MPVASNQTNLIVRLGEIRRRPSSTQAGGAARFAWDEFFQGEIRNEHTRKAYTLAVRRFLDWCEARGADLVNISPGMVGQGNGKVSGTVSRANG